RGYSKVALVILDEASRIPDAIIAAVKPMQATVKDGELIALSTPAGQAGWFYEQWEHGGDVWERTKITAGECRRIESSFLEEELRRFGPMIYRQEYECEFVSDQEQIFLNEIIESALSHPEVTPLWQ